MRPETWRGSYLFNGSLIYEYCTKKNLRDEGGNTVEVTRTFGSELSRDVPGAEEKYQAR